ncbi:unnamed protein product [Jaminaea pallidilutea]
MASNFQLPHLPPVTGKSTPAFLVLARRYLESLLITDTAEEARASWRLVKHASSPSTAAALAVIAAMAGPSTSVAGRAAASPRFLIFSRTSLPVTLAEREFIGCQFERLQLPPVTADSTPAFLALSRRYLEFVLDENTREEARILLALIKVKERQAGRTQMLLALAPPSAGVDDQDQAHPRSLAIITSLAPPHSSKLGNRRVRILSKSKSRQARVRRHLAALDAKQNHLRRSGRTKMRSIASFQALGTGSFASRPYRHALVETKLCHPTRIKSWMNGPFERRLARWQRRQAINVSAL